ncbi:WPP domain-interacting tail-anchored protein 1-like isoform X2 [Benincasa hispida]|uniref:WPP domain-interacting tail-anchored protein 1-like isoform X2 n=2 Tax=Benincasa hispida TaxID=102211 RepID=UPI0019005356|nr:WPP domain-interacting tail-anchored protein 1-like isoform X2 [Benincasa hispida]
MDTDAVSEASTSVICDNTSGLGADENDSISRASGDLANGSEVITRLELDLARASEKLVNLNVLMMRIATRESEFEAFVLENDHMFDDSVEKASEIDLLAGFLDSEVDGVDGFLARIQNDIFHAHELIPFCKFSKETCMYLQEKLQDSKESLKQSHELISEIRMQSAKLQKNLRCYYNGNGDRGTDLQDTNQLLERNSVIDMRTAEHQIHILRMLEKSLAREMDLEKKLTETSQMDDELKLRLHSSQQDVYSLEEELEDVCGRCFEAENASEVLIGISKELLGRLQLLQFHVNGSMQREAELKLKFEGSMEQLKAKDCELLNFKNNNAELKTTLHLQIDGLKSKLRETEEKLIVTKFETVTLKEKVSSLEKQLKESEEKNEALRRQLRESDMQLQQAVASAEASQEKQNMLYVTINDMENLIRDLKLKVAKADGRADRAEENCILLSESYAELNEELRLVRGKLGCLETSLQQAEYRKKASANDIDVRTKVITNLVMQLAIERDRLHKQLSLLAMENKILAAKLQQANQDSVVNDQSNTVETKEIASKQDFSTATATSCPSEIEVDETKLSAAGSKDLNSGMTIGTARHDRGLYFLTEEASFRICDRARPELGDNDWHCPTRWGVLFPH